jgi:virulence factor Mce-like protein
MTRGRTASIVASPVLIGAVTTLIVIVAVFLAYNANQGLPFVPTYNLRAEVTGAANLVKGNEVRVGGFRVGVVDEIGTGTKIIDGQSRSIAVLRMKLDKKVEPLPKDTTVLIRPRSALGLKYVELTIGKSDAKYLAGDTIPLAQSRVAVEFDDFLNTFDFETRQNQQDAMAGFGNALSGRGQDINTAIESLAPFFGYLQPVMRNLADPDTDLDQFFRQIGRAAAQVAPVAEVQARLFTEMADTFAAIGRNPDALRATIDLTPSTLDVAVRSFRAQRPFLSEFADLSRRLRPAAQVLPVALPRLNAAFRVGTPIVRRSPQLNEATGEVLEALQDLAEEPNTLLGLKDLTTLVRAAGPLFTYLNPFQSVCNYAAYWLSGLGGHLSEGTPNGTAERIQVKLDLSEADNRFSDSGNDRPPDLPANVDPTGAKDNLGNNLYTLHAQPYTPAIDAQGNANCTAGNWGYIDRYPNSQGRYPPRNGEPDPGTGLYNNWQNRFAGGSHVIIENDLPFLHGPTFQGIKSLRDVP